jgi:hypothetical protein
MSNQEFEVKKLNRLMRDIRDFKYPPESLSDTEAFRKNLAKDLGMDGEDALALLGFLLTRKYVLIKPDTGLFVNPASDAARKFFEEEKLKAS